MKLAFNTWVYSSFPVWVPAYPLEEVVPGFELNRSKSFVASNRNIFT